MASDSPHGHIQSPHHHSHAPPMPASYMHQLQHMHHAPLHQLPQHHHISLQHHHPHHHLAQPQAIAAHSPPPMHVSQETAVISPAMGEPVVRREGHQAPGSSVDYLEYKKVEMSKAEKKKLEELASTAEQFILPESLDPKLSHTERRRRFAAAMIGAYRLFKRRVSERRFRSEDAETQAFAAIASGYSEAGIGKLYRSLRVNDWSYVDSKQGKNSGANKKLDPDIMEKVRDFVEAKLQLRAEEGHPRLRISDVSQFIHSLGVKVSDSTTRNYLIRLDLMEKMGLGRP